MSGLLRIEKADYNRQQRIAQFGTVKGVQQKNFRKAVEPPTLEGDHSKIKILFVRASKSNENNRSSFLDFKIFSVLAPVQFFLLSHFLLMILENCTYTILLIHSVFSAKIGITISIVRGFRGLPE